MPASDEEPSEQSAAAVSLYWIPLGAGLDVARYSNAKAEAHNRTAKLVARNARGFANPHNQARRVRMATTRTARQARKEAGRGRSPKVTGRRVTARAP